MRVTNAINSRSVNELAPQLYSCISKRRRKATTVAAGLNGNSWARDIQGAIGITKVVNTCNSRLQSRTSLSTTSQANCFGSGLPTIPIQPILHTW
jgi:hypothetical protein